jgi:hypothetical protein
LLDDPGQMLAAATEMTVQHEWCILSLLSTTSKLAPAYRSPSRGGHAVVDLESRPAGLLSGDLDHLGARVDATDLAIGIDLDLAIVLFMLFDSPNRSGKITGLHASGYTAQGRMHQGVLITRLIRLS